MPEPSRKFISMMNEPYLRIVDHARLTWDEAELALTFDGELWVAAIAVGPPRTFDRWASGQGPTHDRAIMALQEALGLPRHDD
jgi:hypothetical protein